MKKYVKPELFYEPYELSQHIANCTLEIVNSTDDKTCQGIPDPGQGMDGWVLLQAEVICEMPWEDYCYESGTSDLTIFAS